MEIGEQIKYYRELRGLSQNDLAIKVGYTSRSAINKIEKGINKPNADMIPVFAKALNCLPKDLTGWDDSFNGSVMDAFKRLDDDDQLKVLDYILLLSEQPKYKEAQNGN